ncbi:MAG: hypothetical protein PHR50_14710 [Lachnospiraceae bacterium]|nr:hypothetical protein [Lachnospiraceae bacterium]
MVWEMLWGIRQVVRLEDKGGGWYADPLKAQPEMQMADNPGRTGLPSKVAAF